MVREIRYIVISLWARQPAVGILTGEQLYLFSSMARPALGLNMPPIKGVEKVLPTTLKWLGHKTYQLHSYSLEVKNDWSCSSAPLYAS